MKAASIDWTANPDTIESVVGRGLIVGPLVVRDVLEEPRIAPTYGLVVAGGLRGLPLDQEVLLDVGLLPKPVTSTKIRNGSA